MIADMFMRVTLSYGWKLKRKRLHPYGTSDHNRDISPRLKRIIFHDYVHIVLTQNE